MRLVGSRVRRCLGILLLSVVFCSCGIQEETSAEIQEPEMTEELSAEGSADDVVYLSMATSGNWEDIARGRLWEEYSRHLLDWSGGKLRMNAYFNGSLGNDLELIEGVKEGTLCIINSVPSYQISVVPEAALLDVPGLFSSTEEYNYFIDHYYMDTLQAFYHKKGLRLLASSAFDFRVLTSNTPVRSREDIKGLKLRTMENKYHVAFWQSLGASVVSMNFNQARLAIQQNLLQAQENPLGYMISSGLSDVQDQVILTNHILMINQYLMNEEQYQALSQENKDLLNRFFREMNEELTREQPEENRKLLESLKEQGIEIYDASEDITDAFSEIAQPRVLELLREDLGDVIVDDFLRQVQLAKADYAAGKS